MIQNQVSVNSVIQINEKGPEGWVGCFVQVSEVKSFGVQGWVQIPKGGQAYIRLNWDVMEYIGEAVMTLPDDTELN
jgi:hypothetical protein